MKWVVIQTGAFGVRVVSQFRDTKLEAEADARTWRQHIARLKKKPEGAIHVITEAKLNDMIMS